MEHKKPKIVFFGTPEFAVASLKALVDGGYDVAAVVTTPDKVGGRGNHIIESDVKKFAVERGLPLLQPERLKNPEFVEALRAINADLFIVIAFRMLPEVVWSMPPMGTFNLHGSLLPKYRGAAPINRAIMNGESETGITTFFLKHEIDTGDMIEQRRIDITDEDNAGTIHDRLMEIGAECVLHTVKSIEDGSLTTEPQPEGDFIPAPKIFKEDCRIAWTRSAREIFNHIRGLSPYPGAWTPMRLANGKPMDVKVFSSVVSSRALNEQPGKVIVEEGRMFVSTGNGSIELLTIQPAGKKRMKVSEFLKGYTPDTVG